MFILFIMFIMFILFSHSTNPLPLQTFPAISSHFQPTAKNAGQMKIDGCIQKPKVSGHPSQNSKTPNFRFNNQLLTDLV